MSPQSGPCVRSVSEGDITGLGDTSDDASPCTTSSWDNLAQDSSTLPLSPKRGQYSDTYPPPPGILTRAPSQATMHFTTVPQFLHLITFHSSVCSVPPAPPGWPPLSCLCLSESPLWEQGELVYPGSSCAQVQTFLHPLLLSLSITNLLSMISSLSYMLLLSSSKHNLTFRHWRHTRKTDAGEQCRTPMLSRNIL